MRLLWIQAFTMQSHPLRVSQVSPDITAGPPTFCLPRNPAALWFLSNLVIWQTGWMEIPTQNNESHPCRAFHRPAVHSSPDKGIQCTAAAPIQIPTAVYSSCQRPSFTFTRPKNDLRRLEVSKETVPTYTGDSEELFEALSAKKMQIKQNVIGKKTLLNTARCGF